jgi:UMF1 family MFS transporter
VLNGVLALWIFVGVAAYVIESPTLFYGMAVLGGLGLGSVQAASRAFMSSLVPDGKEAGMFGFYALCGKSSSVIGPMLFGAVTVWAEGTQRPAFLALTGLFILGLVLLQRVRDPRATA